MVSAWIVSAVMVSVLVLVASDPCVQPGDVLNGSTGYFSSPNFPNKFSANSNCNWTITVPAGRIIKVTFFSFALHPTHNTNCAGGSGIPHVLITNVASDDAEREFKICGDSLPDPVYSVGNSIQVRLITGANIYQGFNASYEAIDGKLQCPEGSTLKESSGVITSPYFPRKYPDKQECIWEITAPLGNHVKLEFDEINMQQCGRAACTCDYLQIQGHSENPNENERICSLPQGRKIFYSIHESLKVQFVSDDTMSKLFEGFKATYTLLRYTPPVCPAEPIPLTGNGKISSPNYPCSNYPASRNCSWIITVPADKRVKVVFTELALGSCQFNCSSGSCTYVELYDGPSANYSSLGRFCSGSTLKEVLSNGSQMFVNFRSGSSLDWGFEAQYEPINLPGPPTCNQIGGPYGLVSLEYDQAELRLTGKECLSNGNRTSYIQIILIQRKDKDEDIGSSTDKTYAPGKDHIIAEFDYGKKETFTIGDGMNYSRTGGSIKYYNDKLKSNTYYAAFQRSFDDSGSYDSEKFVKFRTTEECIIEKPITKKPITEKPITEKPITEKPITEKPTNEKSITEKPTNEESIFEKRTNEKPKISSSLFTGVVVIVALVCAIFGAAGGFFYAKRKGGRASVSSRMEDIGQDKMPAVKLDSSF